MTKYVAVAQALVAGGYLTDADLDAAAAVLADALVVEEAEDAEAAALDDEAYQEGVIAGAEDMEVMDDEMGDDEDEEFDEEIIGDALAQEDADEEIIAEAEDTIDAGYADAAAALVAAELIDAGAVNDVVEVITDVWVVD